MNDEHEWLEEFAVAAGFTVFEDGTMEVPDECDLDELLENFANIIAEVAVKQFVDKMCTDLRAGETLH